MQGTWASGTAKTALNGSVGERFYYSATVSSDKKTLHLKLVNASNVPQPLMLDIPGAAAGNARMYSLQGASFQATNSITEPEKIKPVALSLRMVPRMTHNVGPMTIEVIDVPLK